MERLTAPERDYHASIQFTYWLQYQLHLQLLDASKFAARHRVALKGDLPIGEPPAMRSLGHWVIVDLIRSLGL